MTDEEMKFLASDIARVVAHLAKNIMSVHIDKAAHFAAGDFPTIHDFSARQMTVIMNQLGDILNGMDAVMEEDAWMTPIFERAQEAFPNA